MILFIDLKGHNNMFEYDIIGCDCRVFLVHLVLLVNLAKLVTKVLMDLLAPMDLLDLM